MNLESAAPQQTVPSATQGTQPEKKAGWSKILLTVVFFLFVLMFTAIAAEAIYLSRNPSQKCRLLGCQEYQIIGVENLVPKPLNEERVAAIRKFLDKIAPDNAGGSFYREIKYTVTAQGVVWIAIPEIIELDGVKYVYHLGLQDEQGNLLRYRFTQEEMDIMRVELTTWGGESKDATINDLQEGDYVIIKTSSNLLDTHAGDTIILEIKRESF